jgi:hypothetical protein
MVDTGSEKGAEKTSGSFNQVILNKSEKPVIPPTKRKLLKKRSGSRLPLACVKFVFLGCAES